jgi:hypothetical protein
MDEQPKSHALLVTILVLLALTIPAGAIALMIPMVQCPYCRGEGLVEEPAIQNHWTREADLIPRACPCCGDRRKISKLKKWRSQGSPRAMPPLYTRGARSSFSEVQMDRIRALSVTATAGVMGEPPVNSSMRGDLVPVLLEALKDGNEEIRIKAAEALARMNRKENLPLFVAEVKRPGVQPPNALIVGIQWLARDPELRADAVAVLKEVCEGAARFPPDARFHAAAALLDMDETTSSDIFLQFLHSSDDAARISTRGIVRYDRKDAISLLIKTMEGQSADQMNNQAEALMKMTGEKFGRDADAWSRWFEKNKDRFPPQKE